MEMITFTVMEPVITNLKAKKLIGQCLKMSFNNNKTYRLWTGFMPRHKEIPSPVNDHLYSIEIYSPGFFDHFDPAAEFEKWAAIEVENFENMPQGLLPVMLPDGLYAVFMHKGPASAGPATYNYIFNTWLPNSGYVIDDRPHFAVMDERYKHEAPDSEEELWLPLSKCCQLV